MMEKKLHDLYNPVSSSVSDADDADANDAVSVSSLNAGLFLISSHVVQHMASYPGKSQYLSNLLALHIFAFIGLHSGAVIVLGREEQRKIMLQSQCIELPPLKCFPRSRREQTTPK